MLVTTVIEEITKSISDKLNVSGYAPAYQLPDGKIVVFKDIHKKEREYIGLQDNTGNYFYIRFLSDFMKESAQEKSKSGGSCTQRQIMSIPLRLVAVWKCTTPETLCEKLKACLSEAANISTANIRNLLIEYAQSSVIFEAIYNAETLQTDVAWNTETKLALIDFTLSYSYDLCDFNSTTIEIC